MAKGLLESDYTAEDGTVTLNAQIKQGETVVHSASNLTFESGAISVSIKGSGTQKFTLWINGILISEIEVVFTR